MRVPSGTLPVLALGALVIALANAQLGWRHDRQLYDSLSAQFDRLRAQATFLAAGDHVTDSPLTLRSDAGSVSLADAFAAAGGPRLVLLGRNGCNACDWFGARMDSIAPRWMDSILYVATSTTPGPRSASLHLDKANAKLVPAVPLLLVMDSTGRVLNSAVGLKRILNVLEDMRVPAPSFDQLRSERVTPPPSSGAVDTVTPF